jgi:radical SAM superfamily enzyme YgiQ (UPF0313 family)
VRVALVYPPPWKIPAPSSAPDPVDGPPDEYVHGDLDADFYQIPYGLLAIGAAAKRAGHQVKILNLSAMPWPEVERVLDALDADIWGMSCWTANRRGVALVAEAIKKRRPRAHVAVGGPHATPMPKDVLRHFRGVDTVCIGESDVTFLELCDRVAEGKGAEHLAGAAWRDAAGEPVVGPERRAIADLDALECPQKHYGTHILMTSRGCPWACTFCGAETSWGRGFRSNSVAYTLAAMEAALARLPVKMIQIKDDTFTTNKKRVIELCRAIREKGLRFFWSCDTRVDLLTDELLREMRLAGCERLSLGVESGSPAILKAIDKKITPAEILESTALAKRYGVKVRYYMMLGNRGETRETFAETQRFLAAARPHEYLFSCLSIYPGTRDFDDAEKEWLDRKVYFTQRFQELKTPFDAPADFTAELDAWFARNKGLQRMHAPDVAEYEAILARIPEHHAAHMDLGAALYHAGDLARAEEHVRRALDLGYPCPGLVHNHLGCIAKARGDLDGMMDAFSLAAKVDPQHFVLIQNVNAARAWFKADGPAKKLPLELQVRHDFQLLERTQQPTLPGPLPEDFAVWGEGDALAPAAADALIKTPEQEGSGHGLKDRRKLRVL